MNIKTITALVFTALFAATPALQASERVGDFALLDHEGYFHSMSWHSDLPVIALLVQASGSSTDISAVPAFTAMRDRFDEDEAAFFMLNPMGLANRDEIRAAMNALGTNIPVLMDDSQLVSEALGITHTGEVLLYDPKAFTVLFRGPMTAETEQALRDLVTGRHSDDTARVPG